MSRPLVDLIFQALSVASLIGLCEAADSHRPSDLTLHDQVAAELIQASPLADPGDSKARDAAAARLAECRVFRSALQERVLWGGCEPVKGFDPRLYSLTEFEPLVWLKLYASTIMFTGEHTVRTEGAYSILELKARFRSELDPGDYPYPFWHSPAKWQAYRDLASLAIVFEDDRIVAVYRIAQPGPSPVKNDKHWDGQWRWKDARGQEQPRAALFSYVFGPDNPHRESVDKAYRQLEAEFRAQNCTSCHAPDNKGRAKQLLLLNYPNQSLVSRHEIVQVLTDNTMPPEDPVKGLPAGLSDRSQHNNLIQLARAFATKADAAVSFELARNTGANPNAFPHP